jgi:hypothetical protein
MSSPKVNTTIEHADTVDTKHQVPSSVLVLLWSDSEPHRAGEHTVLQGIEAPMSYAKAVGHSYSPLPSITAPAPDSTSRQSSARDGTAVQR